MKISKSYLADFAAQDAKSTLRGVMQRLGLTLLAFTLVIGAAEAQQAAPPIDGVIGKLRSTLLSRSPSQPISRYPPI
jgi:hypothetical protein